MSANVSKATNAKRRTISYSGYFVGMLASATVFALVGVVAKIDKQNIARELIALAQLTLLLLPVWMIALVAPAVVGSLPFMVIREFVPQNKIARPLFILACFGFSWIVCLTLDMSIDLNPYSRFYGPRPPILTRWQTFLTSSNSLPLLCGVITGALVCWIVDCRAETKEVDVASSPS